MAELPWRLPFDAADLKQIESLGFEALLCWLNQKAKERGLSLPGPPQRPLGFVDAFAFAAGDSNQGSAYEAYIAASGCVPTRDNLHDRYNALIWLAAPKTKAALNHIQAHEIARLGISDRRGGVRDAATLWDENLLVVAASQDCQKLEHLLSTRQWHELFVGHRGHWHSSWYPMIFGHALLEKMAKPYLSVTAHVLTLSVQKPVWSEVDQLLCSKVKPQMGTEMFMALPVMGIPGWHEANRQPDFYADPQIFRPAQAPPRGRA